MELNLGLRGEDKGNTAQDRLKGTKVVLHTVSKTRRKMVVF